MEGEERESREEGRVKRTKGCDLMLAQERREERGLAKRDEGGGVKTGRGGEQRGETQNRESGEQGEGRSEALSRGKGKKAM